MKAVRDAAPAPARPAPAGTRGLALRQFGSTLNTFYLGRRHIDDNCLCLLPDPHCAGAKDLRSEAVNMKYKDGGRMCVRSGYN
ncbi:hypothetical protein EVAR_87606_1 [Eumeta japonica]|uniref:Uncharacterized protein n=1 Tax=Eumeta variegata TaxID=151549 RepID=A0A4C1WMY9_EUMVA|nr:hypothetical protein EVAR_87606_1 [Eumeta japonica]